MILEFKEITSPKFKDEIKKIKNNIKKTFKKEINIYEKFIRKYNLIMLVMSMLAILITCALSMILGFDIKVLFISSIFSIFLQIIISIFLEEKESQERRKIKYSLSNIINHYKNKEKNINAEKVNKLMKKLNPKQKEIVKLINDELLYLENNTKIQYEILKIKIKSCSLKELKSEEKEINLFIENIEDIKVKEKIKFLIIEKENLIKPLFEEDLVIEENIVIEKKEKIKNRIII